MSKDPSMPFYVNDWLSSAAVACMSLEQQGAYLRLLCYCWASQNAELPDDDKALSVLSGMNEGWFNGGSHLVRVCFEPHPNQTGKLTNKKLFGLWQERVEWRRKSSEAGKRSGEVRRKSGFDKQFTKRTNLEPTLNQGSTNLEPTYEPNTNYSSSSSSSSLLVNSTHTHRAGDWSHLSEVLQNGIERWHEHWQGTHGHGKRDTDVHVDSMLIRAKQAGWSDDKIAESITLGIVKVAKSWLDPEADFERMAKNRANGRKASYNSAEIPF